MPRIIIFEPDKTPQPYRPEIDRIITKIGRGSDNDVILTAGSASTYHCELKRIDGGFILIDNDSTNGIKLNETQYSVIDLQDGMTVQIGDDVNMEFTLSDEEKEILAEEDFEPQQRVSFPKPQKQSETPVQGDDDYIVLDQARPKSNEDAPEPEANKGEPLSMSSPVVSKSSSNIGIVIFIILATLFFGGGLAIRHYQDHKTFIFSR